jgi:hypothetical protein
MKLVKYEPGYYARFIKFNESVYPERGDIKTSFQKRILSNPLLKDKNNPDIILALDDDDEIVGQFLISPVEVMYKNEIKQCYFGSDFIVSEKYKNTGAGALLALRSIRSFKPYFAIGVSEDAKGIHLSCNTKIIGCSYKYLFLRKRISTWLKAIKGTISSKGKINKTTNIEFPDEIKCKDYFFKRISELEGFNPKAYNDNIIEFVHSNSFLQWRFFSNPARYAMYIIEGNEQNYFIVRKSFWRGLNLLFIVDYHFANNNEKILCAFLKALKYLAILNNLDGVMTTSSLQIVDNKLKKESFHKIKNPIWVFASSNMVPDANSIDSRNSVFVTPADSDYEFNFDNL